MTISASAPLRLLVLLTSVAMALVLLLSGVVSAQTQAPGTSVEVTHIEHEVQPGDTLWAIAAGYTEPGEDVRRTIHDISVASGLDSSNLLVGEILFIPVDF